MAGNSKVSFQVPFRVKLMSASLAGKSYKVSGKKGNQFVVIHNMFGTSQSSLNY